MLTEQLYVFGTGNAIVIRCYNTCPAIKDSDGGYFMVDTRGGNGVLRILEDMGVDMEHTHHIFLTHRHTDRLLSTIWLVRMISALMKEELHDGNLYIYCHEDLMETITTVYRLTLQSEFLKAIGDTIHLAAVKDGETKQILNWPVTFFDIRPTKAERSGFAITLKRGRRLTCAGDEPYGPLCEKLVAGSNWLLHKTFYLYGDRGRFNLYEKHHSTAKDARQLAEELHIPNLILWRTEGKSLDTRKETYVAEGTQYYRGNLFIPYDGETLEP